LALAAQTAEDDATPRVKSAAPETYRWVNEGGPYGGGVEAVTLCAGNPDVLYAATANGVFKSTDGAATWKPAASLSKDGTRSRCRDVAVDPTNPDIVYAAADDLYKSTDGGTSWVLLTPDGGRSGAAYDVEIDPKNPDTIYVCDINLGVLKSTDGGGTWQLKSTGLINPRFSMFEMDPHFPHTLYGRTWRRKAIYVSSDGGATWRKSAGTIEGVTLKDLKKDPNNPRKLTIVLVHADGEVTFEGHNNGSFWHSPGAGVLRPEGLIVDKEHPQSLQLSVLKYDEQDVYITTDGAETWRAIELPFRHDELKGIRASTTTSDILYAGTMSDVYYYSDDGGESWEFFYSAASDPDAEQTATIAELRTCFLYGLGRVDEQSRWTGWKMIPHPSKPNVVYRAEYSSEGVLKTRDFGKNWLAANEGLNAFSVINIACDPKAPGLVYALTAHTIHKSTDGAKTWKRLDPGALAYNRLLAVHPLDPQIVLVARDYDQAAVVISTDRGETWRTISEIPRTRTEAFVFDSKNADTFYALTNDGVYETTDRGGKWHATGESFKVSYHGLDGASPGTFQTSADVIYRTEDQRRLYRSTDVGKTWEQIKSLPADSMIQFIHVDPKTAIVVDWQDRLLVTNDAGDTWRTIKLPGRKLRWIRSIGMHPTDRDVLYLCSLRGGPGVLRTRDGGKTFEQLSNGLPGLGVVQIVVSPADGAVYAATDGAGVYRLETRERVSNEGGNE
jgi:photosystem II stability/assembly factor-like uncharacterized protein